MQCESKPARVSPDVWRTVIWILHYLEKMTFAQPKRSLSYGSGVSAINELDFSLATKIVFISFNQCGLFRKSGKPTKIWMGMTFRVIQQIRLQSGKQKNQSKFHQRKEKLVDWSAFKDKLVKLSAPLSSRVLHPHVTRAICSFFNTEGTCSCGHILTLLVNQKLECLISVP